MLNTVEIISQVVMHSINITKCHLYLNTNQWKDRNPTQNFSGFAECSIGSANTIRLLQSGEKCRCTVHGTPPDLYLTVLISYNDFKIYPEYWRVTIYNNVGSGELKFTLPMKKGKIINKQF